jgi:hypothetical protein
VGGTEAERLENRFVASLDLRRLNRILWVDKKTMTACCEVYPHSFKRYFFISGEPTNSLTYNNNKHINNRYIIKEE